MVFISLIHRIEDLLFQGGFIWDYIDQSLYMKTRYGEEVLGYGGDFNDRPNDGNFSGNGICFGGDRRETKALVQKCGKKKQAC